MSDSGRLQTYGEVGHVLNIADLAGQYEEARTGQNDWEDPVWGFDRIRRDLAELPVEALEEAVDAHVAKLKWQNDFGDTVSGFARIRRDLAELPVKAMEEAIDAHMAKLRCLARTCGIGGIDDFRHAAVLMIFAEEFALRTFPEGCREAMRRAFPKQYTAEMWKSSYILAEDVDRMVDAVETYIEKIRAAYNINDDDRGNVDDRGNAIAEANFFGDIIYVKWLVLPRIKRWNAWQARMSAGWSARWRRGVSCSSDDLV